MTANMAKPGLWRSIICLLLLAAAWLPGRAIAQQPLLPLSSGQPEAWLITYAPGDLYWQRFGHNAIWIRDPSRNIDHVFNSGFFDFNQSGFLRRFIEGRMLYFSAARPANDEFRQYQSENRSIAARKLNLSLLEYERLLDHLIRLVDPDTREYLYDYYLDNCSTRIRDAIDAALGGRLAGEMKQTAAAQNLRDHTRRSTAAIPGYYLALELALGLPTDRPISRWEEMFLPAVVDEVVGAFSTDGQPLASAPFLIFESGMQAAPVIAPNIIWQFLVAGLLLPGFFGLMGRLAGPVLINSVSNAYLLIAGLGGVLLVYLWLLTDHQVAGPNINLLLLNPLLILGLWTSLRRFAAILLFTGVLLCLGQLFVPAGQYNFDVLALLAPINLAVGWWLWRNPVKQ